jgi:hypothetical protein
VNERIPAHLQPTFERLVSAAISEVPPPWKLSGCAGVGGLESVGFGRGTDLLLVTSSQGRGVFDCLTGQRVARDRSEETMEDSTNLEAIGIGPLDDQIIRMAGLNGGGLPNGTPDGWTADRLVLQWPEETLVLVPPGSWIYGLAFDKPADFVKVFVGSEVRAWGFSATGRSLILATSGDVTMYARPKAA